MTTRLSSPRRTLLLVFAGVLLGVLVVSPESRLLVGIGVMIAGFAYGVRSRRWLIPLFTAALLVRILLIVVDTHIGFLPRPPITTDNHQAVLHLLAGEATGDLFRPVIRSGSYMRYVLSHLLAPFYLLFGSEVISGRLAIAVFGTLVGYPVYVISTHFTDKPRSLLATALVLFWPSLLYRSVLYQREVIVVLAMLTILAVSIGWIDRIRAVDFFFFLPALWLVFVLREQNLFLVGIIVGVALLVRKQSVGTSVLIGSAGIAASFAFILIWLDPSGMDLSSLPMIIDGYAHKRANGDAAYLTGLHYRSFLDIVLAAPLKTVYYLFSPLPWQVTSPAKLIAGVNGWALFFATLLATRGLLLEKMSRRKLAVAASYLLVGILIYAIIEMNFGAAFRRRIQFVPLILVFATLALPRISFSLRRTTGMEEAERTKTGSAD